MLSREWVVIDGTSASAPIFAGLLTLVNDRLLHNGLPPLGWVTPRLYALQPLFRDIVIGDNTCGSYGLDPVCCPFSGFHATVGFDAVTGLGSPRDFITLRDTLVNQTAQAQV